MYNLCLDYFQKGEGKEERNLNLLRIYCVFWGKDFWGAGAYIYIYFFDMAWLHYILPFFPKSNCDYLVKNTTIFVITLPEFFLVSTRCVIISCLKRCVSVFQALKTQRDVCCLDTWPVLISLAHHLGNTAKHEYSQYAQTLN